MRLEVIFGIHRQDTVDVFFIQRLIGFLSRTIWFKLQVVSALFTQCLAHNANVTDNCDLSRCLRFGNIKNDSKSNRKEK